MTILFCLMTSLLLIVDFIKYKKICSPVFVFCALWLFICILAGLRLYGFKGYSVYALLLVMLGVLSFGVGCHFIECIKIKTALRDYKTIDRYFNMTFLNIILFLSSIGSAFSLYYKLKAFASGMSLSQVRESLLEYNDVEAVGNKFISAFTTYFCSPAMTALFSIAIISLFTKRHKVFRRIVFANIILGAVSSGGRISFLYAILQLAAAAEYYKISAKVKKILIRVAAILIVAVVVITNTRTSQGVWFQIYSYFSIPLALFSHYIEVIDSAEFVGYGAATFYPPFYVANSVTKAMGINVKFLNDIVYYVGLPQKAWVQLFPGKIYNAFCSLFYFFYMDFRAFGVIFFSLLYGALSGMIYKKAYKYHNELYFCFYLLILRTIFSSFIIWQVGNTKFFVTVFILFIAYMCNKIKVKKTSGGGGK